MTREQFLTRIKVATLMAQDAGAEVEKARAALRRAELEAAARLSEVEELVETLVETLVDIEADEAIPMLLHCPACAVQHVDEGEWATRAHRTHLCTCDAPLCSECAIQVSGPVLRLESDPVLRQVGRLGYVDDHGKPFPAAYEDTVDFCPTHPRVA